jgi:DNA replication protein DnaC
MKYLMENSNIPLNRQKPASLDTDIDYEAYCYLANVKAEISSFVSNGNNLYITSKETGNGKSSWAIKLMLKYFDDVWAGNGFKIRGVFIHVPTFLLQLKNFKLVDSAVDMLKSMLPTVDLVIWDDIASTELSNYDNTQLLSYIDQRCLYGKANIYTGNITTLERLQELLGTRLASRVWNCSTIVEFKGKDRRK